MSTHAVNVIRVAEVHPHPNADRLDIVPVGMWQAVVARGSFKVGDLAVYVEPDYVVPVRDPTIPEFHFLAKGLLDIGRRLKAIRLRGELSFGLLIPPPAILGEVVEGQNVMDALHIIRYEEPISTRGADEAAREDWPKFAGSKFDIESYANYGHLIPEGTPVIVTEKIHGANARYTYQDGKLHAGSRTRWLKTDTDNVWTRVLRDTPAIEEFCKMFPGSILYGEVYGNVQSLKYDSPNGAKFRAFACATPDGHWYSLTALRLTANLTSLPMAPLLYTGPMDIALIKKVIEGDSLLAPGQMMEGAVIVPQREVVDPRHGRVALKIISNRYWESNA